MPNKPAKAPQQARSILTRQKLVEACAACLVERGLAGASTLAVAEQAGVSQGALFKHFPTKQRLLAAAVAHLLERLSAQFADAALIEAPLTASLLALPWPRRLAPAIDLLWSIFRSAELRAVYEVYVAARTEPLLDAELEGIVDAHRARMLVLARAVFPDLADAEGFELAVGAVIFAMQGASIGLFGAGVRNQAEITAFFTRLAEHELERIATGPRASATPRSFTSPGRTS